jgi:hypothetical protein
MHCEYCGARHYNADMYEVSGSWICPHCYETHTFTCACCGERYPNHEQRYSEVLKDFVCYDCHREEERKLEREQRDREKIVFPTLTDRQIQDLRDAHITMYNNHGRPTEIPVTISDGGLEYTTVDNEETQINPIIDFRVWDTPLTFTINRERNESSNGEGSFSEGSSSVETSGNVWF